MRGALPPACSTFMAGPVRDPVAFIVSYRGLDSLTAPSIPPVLFHPAPCRCSLCFFFLFWPKKSRAADLAGLLQSLRPPLAVALLPGRVHARVHSGWRAGSSRVATYVTTVAIATASLDLFRVWRNCFRRHAMNLARGERASAHRIVGSATGVECRTGARIRSLRACARRGRTRASDPLAGPHVWRCDLCARDLPPGRARAHTVG